MAIGKISPEQAYAKCPLEHFSFETTDEITGHTDFSGQDRALEAVDFGIAIRHKGFNIYVNGPRGTQRHEITLAKINEKARRETASSDWCYVNNFRDPHRPKALQFPPAESAIFKNELADLITILRKTIPSAVEGEVFQEQLRIINEKLRRKVEKLFDSIEKKARTENIAVIKSEQGILFAPIDENDKPIDQEAFNRLPLESKKKFEHIITRYQAELKDILSKINTLKRDTEEIQRKLKRETVAQTVSSLINTLKKKYENCPEIKQYLQDVEDDIIEHGDDFLYKPDKEQNSFVRMLANSTPSFERYSVNSLVANQTAGAPVVYEDLPTYQNLHGRIEHRAQLGILSTDFTLIKPGSLHRANGGYIVIDAGRLLMQPYAYEGLKRSLRSGQIRIEPIERLAGLTSTATLEPEPVPLNIKVILVGDTLLYYLLKRYDPEFQSFFKVQADFEDSIDRSPENICLFGTLLASVARQNNLLPLHRSAVARVIEHAARLAGEGYKLSLAVEGLSDVLKEADYIARQGDKNVIGSIDIQSSLDAKRRREGRIKERMFEAIVKGLKHISTSGECIGQVNGVSVIALDDQAFGVPTRITALTRPGKGEVIDIEKEVDLGGPIHSKGVLILDSFLSTRYVRDIPLSLRASLVFEQSYGTIEGDSASCAELCALLSSLANVPVRQSIAITGAISQRGEIQAIGGVNEKIEGFFDLCAFRGLSGRQGVIVPKSNIRHLMLKTAVVDAIEAGKFHVWFAETVDEAIALLTTLPAGDRGPDGQYPERSVNGMVEMTLRSFAIRLQLFDKMEAAMGDPSEDGPPLQS
ncbi:MAG: Lon protease family protein [Desulforhopalus sp.]